MVGKKTTRALTSEINNRLVKSKRSQMKIQQTAFMLIAVTLFFVLVGLAIVGIKLSGLKESATDLEQQNALLLVSKLANSPEFSCGKSFGARKTDCVDADKIMVLKENEERYRGFWGASNIEIRKLYPKINGEVKCTMSNYPNCNVIDVYNKTRVGNYYGNFVTLCRKESKNNEAYDKCELAKLLVSYEKKE